MKKRIQSKLPNHLLNLLPEDENNSKIMEDGILLLFQEYKPFLEKINAEDIKPKQTSFYLNQKTIEKLNILIASSLFRSHVDIFSTIIKRIYLKKNPTHIKAIKEYVYSSDKKNVLKKYGIPNSTDFIQKNIRIYILYFLSFYKIDLKDKIEDLIIIFERARDKGYIKTGHTIESTLLLAIWYIKGIFDLKISLKKILSIHTFDTFLTTYSRFLKILDLKKPIYTFKQQLSTYLTYFNLGKYEKEISSFLKKINIEQGKNPKGYIGAIIYFLSKKKSGRRITQKEISEKLNISGNTLRKRIKEIEDSSHFL